MAPRELASPLHSLPPILHMMNQNPISGCSKGSRGLSVLLQVARIFTGNAISPSPSLRQRPSRYAIRAGRNLPDKEFRYLRTVIVHLFHMSPCGADHIFTLMLVHQGPGVWPLRIPGLGVRAFPADCPHSWDCHCLLCEASTRRYSDFPAYSRVFPIRLPG